MPRDAVVDHVCHCQLPAVPGYDGQQPSEFVLPFFRSHTHLTEALQQPPTPSPLAPDPWHLAGPGGMRVALTITWNNTETSDAIKTETPDAMTAFCFTLEHGHTCDMRGSVLELGTSSIGRLHASSVMYCFHRA